MKIYHRALSLLLCLLLTMSMIGCAKQAERGIPENGSVLGTGARHFTFEAKLPDGTVYTYTIQTDAETVGKALQEQRLVEGEDSEYGLYIKSVLGVTLDYEKDGAWWGLYQDGTAASVGADQLSITDGSTYTLAVEKA